MLKQVGRPELVASRYLPQQYLIGPVLFPVYKFVLKIAMLCCLVPWILTWIALMSYDPAYRPAHSGRALLDTLGSFWISFWIATFMAVGAVTIVFVVLDSAGQIQVPGTLGSGQAVAGPRPEPHTSWRVHF
jgi:hypothetical protein